MFSIAFSISMSSVLGVRVERSRSWSRTGLWRDGSGGRWAAAVSTRLGRQRSEAGGNGQGTRGTVRPTSTSGVGEGNPVIDVNNGGGVARIVGEWPGGGSREVHGPRRTEGERVKEGEVVKNEEGAEEGEEEGGAEGEPVGLRSKCMLIAHDDGKWWWGWGGCSA